MLEVKDLKKVYKTKGGVEVSALDGVSVTFPEKGMVFLLGKSGSGKSTLLNVTGGLDKPDGGEIIVKGRSSKEFSASDFDSYRNTFIGFVFQEYNILNEFTIEQNVALALQLQNKPNDKKAVAELLEQVDLADYGKRKPNTLSGGQKQRVAIARALIKQPEIIMADEPTGALDSNTGKQVMETLKKLSETKLVIVVSHDREFAETYGDRIIELKDGKIISDVTKTFVLPENSEENVIVIGDTIRVKNGEEITDADLKKIGAILKSKKGEAIVAAGEKEVKDVKRLCKIRDDGSQESFRSTENVEIASYNGRETKFIKSRLPMGHAIKMGASGLKSKPIRLIFTILLSVVAFVMFGTSSTFMLYDPNYSIAKALKEANYPAIVLSKSYKVETQSVRLNVSTGEERVDSSGETYQSTLFGAAEVGEKSKSGLRFAGIFNFTDTAYDNPVQYEFGLVSGAVYTPVSVRSSLKDYYVVTSSIGFSDCGESYLSSVGYRLSGKYPEASDEIALPEYLARTIVETEAAEISSPEDLIGKTIRFSGGVFRSDEKFKVTAICSVGEIASKYDVLKTAPNSIGSEEKGKLKSALYDYLKNSFHTVIFVGNDFHEAFKGRIVREESKTLDGVTISNLRFSTQFEDRSIGEWDFESVFSERLAEIYKSELRFRSLDGSVLASPSFENGKIYLNAELYQKLYQNALARYLYSIVEASAFDPNAKAIFGGDAFRDKFSAFWDATDLGEYVAYAQTWFQALSYKKYLYEAAATMRNSGDAAYWSGAFSDAFEKIENFKNGNEEAAPPTAEDWNAIESLVSSDYLSSFKQAAYAAILEFYGENIFGDQTWEILAALREQRLSESDFLIYKEKTDAFLSAKGKSVNDVKEIFAFGANDLVKHVYFCDKHNEKGTLEVAGVFETVDSRTGISYALSASWLEAHGTQREGNEYSWRTIYRSEYARPADAKYNLILSPTDNSQAQIAAALSSESVVKYEIESGVYELLQTFLELISMLEKVFLIVGAVVGTIAALFLLNFISVSISSKRRDIGILRAVGARGSDVFKIFYAEAFIIALVCFILASIGSFVVCFFLNKSLADALSMQLLNFNVANVGLIFGVAFFVSVIATFFPVFFAAKKSPVDSIRAL